MNGLLATIARYDAEHFCCLGRRQITTDDILKDPEPVCSYRSLRKTPFRISS